MTYKITNTTDNKYLGREISSIKIDKLKLSNDFEVDIDIRIESGDDIIVGNYNYLITLQKLI